MHLLGMEQDDVRRLVRQAMRDDGAIDADDVRRVLATKYEALGGVRRWLTRKARCGLTMSVVWRG